MTNTLKALRRELIRELCRLACTEDDGDYERVLELQAQIQALKAQEQKAA